MIKWWHLFFFYNFNKVPILNSENILLLIVWTFLLYLKNDLLIEFPFSIFIFNFFPDLKFLWLISTFLLIIIQVFLQYFVKTNFKKLIWLFNIILLKVKSKFDDHHLQVHKCIHKFYLQFLEFNFKLFLYLFLNL